MSVILVIQVAEIRGLQFMRCYLKKKSQKSAVGVAQVVGTEFKPQYKKKRERRKEKGK
jgi:hypothetical protein